MAYKNIEDQRKYGKVWYNKNRVIRTKQIRKWQDEQIKKFKEYKAFLAKKGCIICGYNKCIRALDFHHINGKDKSFRLSLIRGKSWKTILEEIKKCIMVCKNCHTEIHAGVAHVGRAEPL